MTLHIVTCAVGVRRETSNGLRVFLNSIERNVKDAQVYVLSPDLIDGIETVPAIFEQGSPILTRWKVYSELLRTIPEDEIVLLADSRDLVFNGDPTTAIELFLVEDKPLFFSEHQLTGQHRWCRDQARLLGRFAYKMNDLDKLEINGGVIAGKSKTLHSFSREIAFAVSVVQRTKLSDQPIINKWARENPHEIVTDRCLYCHGELVAQHRWGSPDPCESTIYHQYDRVPEHKRFYEDLYLRKELPSLPTDLSELDFHVVISHFNENLRKVYNWIDGIPTTVYSKSYDPEQNAIPLPNEGFESQTWMYHFSENYDSLPKVTICLQGNPFDHFGRDSVLLRRQVASLCPDEFRFMPLSGKGHGATQLRNGLPHHPGLGPDLYGMWDSLLGKCPPEKWYSSYGGMFAVHRDVVRRLPREFYSKGASLIKTKEQACAVERMWSVIFGDQS